VPSWCMRSARASMGVLVLVCGDYGATPRRQAIAVLPGRVKGPALALDGG
jgi:hypothetical protein